MLKENIQNWILKNDNAYITNTCSSIATHAHTHTHIHTHKTLQLSSIRYWIPNWYL